MTDHAIGANCAACETPLNGRYCHACGQDTRARPVPLRQMAVEVATSYSPIDGKMARTLAVLALRPGRLLEAYRAGAGSLYVTPLKLFVATTALFLAVMNFSGTTLYQSTWRVTSGQTPVAVYDPVADMVVVNGADFQERWLKPQVRSPVDPAIGIALRQAEAQAIDNMARAAFRLEHSSLRTEELVNQRLSAWLPNVIWLLMPLYALGLIPLFGRRRLFLEHVIFAMWAHAVGFILLMGLAALNGRGLDLPPWAMLPPFFAYFTVAASRYYARPWWSALWRGVVHLIGYMLLVLLPVSMIIYMTGVDWSAFKAWMAA
jgi:Protein of unknown function (DUF3667)